MNAFWEYLLAGKVYTGENPMSSVKLSISCFYAQGQFLSNFPPWILQICFGSKPHYITDNKDSLFQEDNKQHRDKTQQKEPQTKLRSVDRKEMKD